MKAPTNAPAVGEIIAGKYRVEGVLGVGGMGVVVKAYHEALDQFVALKFLLPEAAAVPELVARFAREARAAARIQGEHVVRVLDVGALPNGAPFMVMEFLHGHDLSGEIERRGALTVEEAVDYVLQACDALAQAHVLGIVHRDIKPQNMFLTRRADGSSVVKLLDFGISKVQPGTGGGSSEMTKTQAMMGSPNFMSPEQLVSPRSVDGRTDIWALGVVLYKLLVGEPPFDGETMPELCARIMTMPPPPIAGRVPGVPPGIEAVVMRCLAKDREDRYRDVAALAQALAPFAPARAAGMAERVTRIVRGGTAPGVETAETAVASDAIANELRAVRFAVSAPPPAASGSSAIPGAMPAPTYPAAPMSGLDADRHAAARSHGPGSGAASGPYASVPPPHFGAAGMAAMSANTPYSAGVAAAVREVAPGTLGGGISRSAAAPAPRRAVAAVAVALVVCVAVVAGAVGARRWLASRTPPPALSDKDGKGAVATPTVDPVAASGLVASVDAGAPGVDIVGHGSVGTTSSATSAAFSGRVPPPPSMAPVATHSNGGADVAGPATASSARSRVTPKAASGRPPSGNSRGGAATADDLPSER